MRSTLFPPALNVLLFILIIWALLSPNGFGDWLGHIGSGFYSTMLHDVFQQITH